MFLFIIGQYSDCPRCYGKNSTIQTHIYTNITKMKICLFERGNLGNHQSIRKNILALDSLSLEEDYKLFHITLRPLGAEQKEKEP